MNPKILLIDDDPLMLATYRDLLGDHGLDVTEAQSPEAALSALEQQGPWDVIVLDELLRGPGGSAMATELLGQIATHAPEARTIVITGFATVPRVKAAVAAGAWDYLQKEAEYLDILLPLRVRHAVEAARERRLRGVSSSDLERELRQTWSAALAPGLDANKKGRLLEETLYLLFRAIPGLDQVSVNRRGAAEEFDVVVTNNSTDPVLSKEGSFFLVECKNWSRPVDPRELSVFRDKLRDRFGRVRLGLLIGVSGFTPGVGAKIDRWSSEDPLVLTLDSDDLTDWIDQIDRVEWLKRRIQAAALRA